MKKYSLIFVLLAVFSLVCTAFADVDLDNLPPIDKESAAEFLGTWYMDSLCETESTCVSLKDFDVNSILTINEDNTLVLSAAEEDDKPEVISWYMENEKAYLVTPLEDETLEISEMLIDEKGKLIMKFSDSKAIFSREEPVKFGTAAMKEDAVVEDFLGKWFVYSFGDSKDMFAASLIGFSAELDIKEDGKLDITFLDENEENVFYTFEDGKIQGDTQSLAVLGETKFNLEYHVDESILMKIAEGTDKEMFLVFVREENAPDINLLSLMLFGEESSTEATAEESAK